MVSASWHRISPVDEYRQQFEAQTLIRSACTYQTIITKQQRFLGNYGYWSRYGDHPAARLFLKLLAHFTHEFQAFQKEWKDTLGELPSLTKLFVVEVKRRRVTPRRRDQTTAQLVNQLDAALYSVCPKPTGHQLSQIGSFTTPGRFVRAFPSRSPAFAFDTTGRVLPTLQLCSNLKNPPCQGRASFSNCLQTAQFTLRASALGPVFVDSERFKRPRTKFQAFLHNFGLNLDMQQSR